MSWSSSDTTVAPATKKFGVRAAAILALAVGSLSIGAGCLGDNVPFEGMPDATPDVPGPDAPPPTCDQPGAHYPAEDTCNWCECSADGLETCTTRACVVSDNTCEYGGEPHPYGVRFDAGNGCNECVCAASGLACTVRDCGVIENSAILLDSLDDACGEEDFTGHALLAYLQAGYDAGFSYDRDRPANLYPETAADSRIAVNVAYDGGYIVCRMPDSNQAAIDMDARLELRTADGAFDEGMQVYLRRTESVFWDGVSVLGGVIPSASALHGTYDPNCLDAGALSVYVDFDHEGRSTGSINKVCEIDMSLPVGTWSYPAP